MIIDVNVDNHRSHALIGIGGSELFGDILSLAPGGIGIAYKIIVFFDDITGVFPNLQHDLIVEFDSQQGGIDSLSSTTFLGIDSIHSSTTSSQNYANRITHLLNTNIQSVDFSFLPAPSKAFIDMNAVNVYLSNNLRSGTVFDDGMIITMPANGSILEPG